MYFFVFYILPYFLQWNSYSTVFNLLPLYISFLSSLVKNKAWLPLTIFCFSGACLFTSLRNLSVIKLYFSFGSSVLSENSVLFRSRGKSRTNMWVQQVSMWKNVGPHGWLTEKNFDFRWAKTVLKRTLNIV